MASPQAPHRIRPKSFLSRCRHPWAGWVQVLASALMILSPLPGGMASWSDGNADGNNDTWTDPQTSQSTSLTELNNQNTDADSDGATNDEEAAEGTNPFNIDTDYDGLSDGDELHIVKPSLGVSLTDWDSDDDEVSDYDEWYNFSGVTYPGGQLPSHPNASYSDYDGDGFKNPVDPFPSDPTNYSSTNSVAWYGDVLGDADSDSTPNWQDTSPYPVIDSDGDGIEDGSDPYPNDSTNYSGTNGISWYNDVFGDSDSDGTLNWQDSEPYGPPTQSDSDYDGFTDNVDPFPSDSTNYSSINGVTWHGDVLGDADSDGTPNWQDSTPYSDSDSDGIVDATDPYPNDATNYSSINGHTWYGDVLGDADSDGYLNYTDPDPDDFTNYSSHNGIAWYNDALGDHDADGQPNWFDTTPLPDSDGDGLADQSDPFPSDNTNFSSINNTAWHGNVLGDNDSDSVANWADPYPGDSSNYSPINSTTWHGDMFGDLDGDGYANYADAYPNDPSNGYDGDGDGLTQYQEVGYGTSDTDVDCDDDGLTDYEEKIVYSSDPLNAYSRSQSLGWGDLYMDYALVDLTDSDADGIPNRIETLYGLLPNDPADAAGDLDANGLSNRAQYLAGLALNVDLNRYDYDLDGMTDIYEDHYQLNKYAFQDALEDPDNDGVLNVEEAVLALSPRNANSKGLPAGGLSPRKDLEILMKAMLYPEEQAPTLDQDANGIADWMDAALVGASPRFARMSANDLDGDSMPDVWEHTYGRWKFPSLGLYLRHDDADDDPDEDGLTNLQEYDLGTNPVISDSNQNSVGDGDEDADGDGLTNAQEYQHGTNPVVADTDGDGVSDGAEVAAGTDPLDAQSQGNALGLRVFTELR